MDRDAGEQFVGSVGHRDGDGVVSQERGDEFRGRDGVDAVVVPAVEIRRGFCHTFVFEVFERAFGRVSGRGELQRSKVEKLEED